MRAGIDDDAELAEQIRQQSEALDATKKVTDILGLEEFSAELRFDGASNEVFVIWTYIRYLDTHLGLH